MTFQNFVSTEESAEVLSSLTELLTHLVKLGIAPTATAFVLPPEVEGASLMAPLWVNCYKAANSALQGD